MLRITLHMHTAFGLAEICHSGRKWMHHMSCHHFMKKGLVDLLRLGRSRLMRYQETMGQGCLGMVWQCIAVIAHKLVITVLHACSLKKAGFSAEEAKALVATTQATLERERERGTSNESSC